MSDFLDDLREDVTALAKDYATGGGVQVYVKTNYGPELPVYTGIDQGGDGPGLADVIGLKAQIIIKDKDGRVITKYGDPAPTEPLKAAALGLVVGTILWFAWRAI